MKNLVWILLTAMFATQAARAADSDTDYLRDLQALCTDDAAVDRLLRDQPTVAGWFREYGRSLCAEAGQAAAEEQVDDNPNRWDRLASPMTIERLELIMAQPEPSLFTGGDFARECWIDDFHGDDSLCTTQRLKLHRLGMPMDIETYNRLKNYCAGKYPDADLQRPCITDWIEKRWIMDGVRAVPRAKVAGATFDDYVEKAQLTAQYKPKPVQRVAAPVAATPTLASTRPAVTTPRPAPVAQPVSAPQPQVVEKTAPAPQRAAPQPKGKYGAIALSHSNTSFRYGFVTNAVSADAARRAAVAQCGDNCSVPTEHGVFTECGAIVFGRQATARGRYVHWHTASTKESAESVINECRWNRNVTCTVDASGCN